MTEDILSIVAFLLLVVAGVVQQPLVLLLVVVLFLGILFFIDFGNLGNKDRKK